MSIRAYEPQQYLQWVNWRDLLWLPLYTRCFPMQTLMFVEQLKSLIVN
mgnify:CR=1 FL=1